MIFLPLYLFCKSGTISSHYPNGILIPEYSYNNWSIFLAERLLLFKETINTIYFYKRMIIIFFFYLSYLLNFLMLFRCINLIWQISFQINIFPLSSLFHFHFLKFRLDSRM